MPSDVFERSIFTDLNKKQVIEKITEGNDFFVYDDCVKKIMLKIENETRKIAGWDCRKAIGRIQDSVYVAAFYSTEIIPQGGANSLPVYRL